jgi:hypothetical protein
MSEKDECIFKPPSLPTQIILTHIQDYECYHVSVTRKEDIFPHTLHEKEDISATKDEKKENT